MIRPSSPAAPISPRPSGFHATALALAAAFTLLYLATPTRHYTFDAVAYAYQIDCYTQDGRPGWLFHAHHLLFNAAGWALWAALREMGLRVTTLEALQGFNALMGGVGVGLSAWILAGRTLRPALAVVMALLLGVTHGYWTCATDGRVNLPGLVLVIAAFGAALRWLESGSLGWSLGSSVLTGLAVLFHQSHVLFVPVLALTALLCRARWRRRLGTGLVAALALLVTVGTGYLTVAVLVKGVRDAAGLQAWLWQYGADGRWWSLDWRSNLTLSAGALVRAVWPHAGSPTEEPFPIGSSLPDLVPETGLAAVLLLVGGGYCVAKLPQLLRRHGSALLLCAVWFAAYAAFFTIWNPGYFVFWLPPLAAAWFGVGFILGGLLPASSSPAPASARQRLIQAAAALDLVALRCLGSASAARAALQHRPRPTLARLRSAHMHLRRGLARHRLLDHWQRARCVGGNVRTRIRAHRVAGVRTQARMVLGQFRRLATAAGRLASGAAVAALCLGLVPVFFLRTYREAIRPRMEADTNSYLQIATALGRATRPGDLILVAGTGRLAGSEVYIPYFSKRSVLSLQQVLKQHGGDKETAFAYLRYYMERRWLRGDQVYVFQEALTSGAAYEVLEQRYGLTGAEALQFFHDYGPRPALQAGPHPVCVLTTPRTGGYEIADFPLSPIRLQVLALREQFPEPTPDDPGQSGMLGQGG